MSDLIRGSWKFILERLSTSTLSIILFSVIIPVVVFGFTSLYVWRTSGGHVPLARILKETIAPTAISIGVTGFGLLMLLGWGIIATLRRDYQSMKVTISERDKEIKRLQTASTQSGANADTSDPWLFLLHARQKLEAELQSLLEIEESGVKLIPQIKIGKDESDYHREQIERLKRDIGEIGKRLAPTKHKDPDITGEILHARRPVIIHLTKGQEQSMLLLKLRVSTRTDIASTIRRANLIVESNGKRYEGKKQPIEIEPVTVHYQFSQPREERPFDLIERIEKVPLRRSIGTEGWLQFLVDDLPNAVSVADLHLTITDELGGEHLISAKSLPID